MGKNMKYHKSEKVWVRKKENRFQYFNIIEWQYMDFSGNLANDNFATYDDFTERWSWLLLMLKPHQQYNYQYIQD